MLAGCASIHGQGDSATDNVVSIELRLDGQTCKPYVNPEDITARKNRPVVRWDITDNCNQSEDEAETQLVFQYQQGTPRKWLDAEDCGSADHPKAQPRKDRVCGD